MLFSPSPATFDIILLYRTNKLNFANVVYRGRLALFAISQSHDKIGENKLLSV
jgi:hypothetical protein